ncbi:MAG: c-type cytochrome [Gammaproteobacteria bacterium]|jgi:cytochrome c|nr:c-type cytochrome [Gammaproteobacteria bacterium]
MKGRWRLWTSQTLASAAAMAVTVPMAVYAQAPIRSSIEVSSAEYKRGKLLYIQCRACHDLQPSEIEKIGPNLANLMGRKAAADPAFDYSPALQAAAGKLVWDRAMLDRWIEKPAAVVPGNTMAFAGVSNPADRAALLAYLEAETAAR